MKRQIQLIVDDMSVCRSIKVCMEKDGTAVCYISSPGDALENFLKQQYCLVIMDLQLPGLDGQEIIRIMREVKRTPILVITKCLTSDEKVRLFQSGATAYIEKPVDVNVCAAQSATLIELYSTPENKRKTSCPLTFGTELVINPLYRQVIIDGMLLDLTRTEFDLLFCLAQRPGQVWSRNQLYHYVWDDTLGVESVQTVKTHIGNLKKKLIDMGKDYIQNSRGVGYRFVPPTDTAKN